MAITVNTVVRLDDIVGTVVAMNDRGRVSTVEFDDGHRATLATERLIDVEREEYQSLFTDPHQPLCNVYGETSRRHCGLPKGHFTPYHRNCEISWKE